MAMAVGIIQTTKYYKLKLMIALIYRIYAGLSSAEAFPGVIPSTNTSTYHNRM